MIISSFSLLHFYRQRQTRDINGSLAILTSNVVLENDFVTGSCQPSFFCEWKLCHCQTTLRTRRSKGTNNDRWIKELLLPTLCFSREFVVINSLLCRTNANKDGTDSNQWLLRKERQTRLRKKSHEPFQIYLNTAKQRSQQIKSSSRNKGQHVDDREDKQAKDGDIYDKEAEKFACSSSRL